MVSVPGVTNVPGAVRQFLPAAGALLPPPPQAARRAVASSTDAVRTAFILYLSPPLRGCSERPAANMLVVRDESENPRPGPPGLAVAYQRAATARLIAWQALRRDSTRLLSLP